MPKKKKLKLSPVMEIIKTALQKRKSKGRDQIRKVAQSTLSMDLGRAPGGGIRRRRQATVGLFMREMWNGSQSLTSLRFPDFQLLQEDGFVLLCIPHYCNTAIHRFEMCDPAFFDQIEECLRFFGVRGIKWPE